MIYQPNVKLQEKINNREKERIITFFGRLELNNFVENKMRKCNIKVQN